MSNDFYQGFIDIFDEYAEEIEADLVEGVREGAEVIKKGYETYASVKKWNNYKKNFVIKEYSGKSKFSKNGFFLLNYIGNSSQTKDKWKIPLINLLTYGATRSNRGVMKPDAHISRIYNNLETEAYNKIYKKLNK